MEHESPMRISERMLTTTDDVTLLVRHRQPDQGPSGRTLIIVHGACEHGGHYDHVAEAAAANGWDTLVADHRGHGRSTGHRAHVSRFRDYVSDLELIQREYNLAPATTAMLGHSMGGLVAIRYAQKHPESLSALALVGPLLKPARRVHPITSTVGRVLSVIAPRTRYATRIEPGDVTSDPEMLRRRENDPLMQTHVTAGWYFEARAAISKAWKRAPQMKLPLLIMQGALDRIVDPLATESWAEVAGSPDKTFELFPEHLHELLNEPDRNETIQSILTWLNARVPLRE